MRQFADNPLERWAYIYRDEKPNANLAIFVHGFYGGYLSTWGRLPDLLYREGDAIEGLRDFDYLFIGYKTRSVSDYKDLSLLVRTYRDLADRGRPPFRRRYRFYALFGHSLGTLAVRQVYVDFAKGDRRALSTVSVA